MVHGDSEIQLTQRLLHRLGLLEQFGREGRGHQRNGRSDGNVVARLALIPQCHVAYKMGTEWTVWIIFILPMEWDKSMA